MHRDYKAMLDAYATAGGPSAVFKNSEIAHLVVHNNEVIGAHLVEGLVLEPKERASGVEIELLVKKGIRIENPVHLCFGVLPEDGSQKINMKAKIEQGAWVKVLAHCVFPNAVRVVHKMIAEIEVADNARYEYREVHFHGSTGGVDVVPKGRIKVGDNSRAITSFSLLRGRVGVFDLDYAAEIQANSVLEMVANVYGYADDKIKLREAGRLAGESSRGLIKSRIAVRDNAQSEVVSELIASAPNASGHVDCVEVVQGNAKAKAVPIVTVTHHLAKVTHEAAIGRVDKKQVQTLMARGLEEEKAIDIVVSGMLK